MIHKTAIVDSEAKISDNVEIGPYCIIGPEVEIGNNSVIHSHVNIVGNTCLLYTSPSPRDRQKARMPSSA